MKLTPRVEGNCVVYQTSVWMQLLFIVINVGDKNKL